MVLEILDFLQGSFSLVFVCFSLILALKIFSKYFEYKTRTYIFVSLTWIGVASPWFPDSISFLKILIFNAPLEPEWYFIIGNALLPFFLLCWLVAFTDLLYKDKQKLILSIFIILGVIFEILFFYLLITDIDEIGVFLRPFQVEFGTLITIYFIMFIAIILISGVLFAKQSIKSEKPDVILKGKFLFLAFISFTIGAILDSAIGSILDATDPLLPIFVVIIRLILISSALEFYCGFILPKWLENFLIKDKR
ncbi:MAG: hypothetical protein ACTSRI_06410 [Promethearchaeota archaeon]